MPAWTPCRSPLKINMHGTRHEYMLFIVSDVAPLCPPIPTRREFDSSSPDGDEEEEAG